MVLPAGVTQLGTFKGKKGDKGDKGEPGGEPSAIVDWMSEPGSAPAAALDALIRSQVQPLWASAGLVVIFHGADVLAPRLNSMGETFDAPALWVGTVVPGNRAEGDFFFYSTGLPMPIPIWADSGAVPGALVTTEIGNLPWSVTWSGSSAYAAAKSAGAVRFTSAGSGVAGITVADGATDCTFRVTIANTGTQDVATVFPRWVSAATHLALHRLSSSDGTYTLSRRVSSAQTVIGSLAGFVMADGDELEITTKSDETLIIKINGVEAFNDVVEYFPDATARGVGVRTPDNALTVAFTDLGVWTLGV